MMKTEYKYIYFEVVEEKPKTKVWGCYNKRTKNILAFVKWYPVWRQYCFFSEQQTVFNTSCLKDVAEFLDQLNEAQKTKKY